MKAAKEITDELVHLQKQVADLDEKNTDLVNTQSERRFASTGRVARNIAHEIRNPLTNINLAVEQLLAELPLEENTRFLFDMINRNSKRINQIISELLTSTRFSELHICNSSLHDLLEEILGERTEQLHAQNIEVIKTFDPAVTDIPIDRDKLKQAIENLVNNSLEAMEGKEGAKLTIATEKKEDKVILTITDNGKGMNEEDEKRVFEPYFTKKQAGLGLSLTTSQNIILNHQGLINVKTAFGEGTSFTVCLNNE